MRLREPELENLSFGSSVAVVVMGDVNGVHDDPFFVASLDLVGVDVATDVSR